MDGCGPLERDLASQDLAQHNKVATEAEERVLEGRGLVLLEHKVADLCVCVCVCVSSRWRYRSAGLVLMATLVVVSRGLRRTQAKL